jgi:hypothetical protein
MSIVAPPSPASPDPAAEALAVSVQGGKVLLQGQQGVAFILTPEAAVEAAERLLTAAEQASSGEVQTTRRAKPPFPPAELVSPHGAA